MGIMFHFCRVAGFDWLWECDGDVGPGALECNHVQDGDMEEAGLAYWSSVAGAAVTKDDSIVRSGGQSLKVVATGASQGVVSDDFLFMNVGPINNILTGNGDSLSGPANGVMTLTSTDNPFGESYDLIGASMVVSGSNPGLNNGRFPVLDVPSSSQIRFFNPLGTAESYADPNPPTTPGYQVTFEQIYKYEVDVWAYNAGPTWNVEIDPGTGSFGSYGTIPNNGGVWTRYHFQFHMAGGSAPQIRFLSTAAGTLYLDGVLCYRSLHEYLGSDHYPYYGAFLSGDAIDFSAGTCTLTVADATNKDPATVDISFGASVCTLTDTSGPFSSLMVGKSITINGSGAGNDGVFTVNSYISSNQITYLNAGGATENPFPGRWAVGGDFVPSVANFRVAITGSGSGNDGLFNIASYIGPAMLTYPNASGADEPAYSGTAIVGQAAATQGTDGILTNPDRFSTGGSYTPGGWDVGKHLFVWDPTNPTNSGCYEIIASLGGGVVQLDLRSPTASLTTQSGLAWRIYHMGEGLPSRAPFPQSGMPQWEQSAGFGIESPHTSKWRLFVRHNQGGGQTFKNTQLWSAPADTGYRVQNGHFYRDGPSVMRNRALHWTKNLGGGGNTPLMHSMGGEYLSANSDVRVFAITDVDLSFLGLFVYGINGGDHQGLLVGYLGTDAQHPGIMAFYHFSPWEAGQGQNGLWLIDSAAGNAMGSQGTGFRASGEAVRSALGQLAFAENDQPASEANVVTQANARANPFSSREWVHKLFIAQDPEGQEQAGGEMDSDCGVFQGRINLGDLTTFDSDNYLHIAYGIVLEWSGEQIP
jgi:hypothetical protein